ncbi:cation channel sperm-associated auxiliary subunit zeta isoform X1 [Mirounga angustirostris]|uniref:cation channel sperm-associated auxiliary subunit zeta isoform X1 n=1 Tax=Mirounga angustirostris TaxID=9716 RepID=UPI001E68BB61|nr:cation channel sperm-associated auxiliary subunit zeta isoform X1 [Mirounga angustirostris]
MEEKPFKASLGSHGSDKSSPDNDIRNLWTRATLSQPKLNVPRSSVGEDSDMEGSGVGSKSRRWYNLKAGRDSDGAWEEWDDGEDKDSFRQEDLGESSLLELELRRASSLGSRLGEDVDSKTDTEMSSSESSLNISKHTPHRAYWMEQQNRLPLPLMELMESEALEILTKALRSEPLPQLPQETLGDSAGFGPLGVGFQDVSALSDSLTTHQYSRSPTKSKKLGDWAQGHPVGRA